jgi:glycosyltransferase involved in cell wall biosynthesis
MLLLRRGFATGASEPAGRASAAHLTVRSTAYSPDEQTGFRSMRRPVLSRPTSPDDHGGVVCFATQGQGHIEGERIRVLLESLEPLEFPFDRAHKLRSAIGLFKQVRARKPDLVVMEGTGTAGGLTLLVVKALLGVPFVFSSGDAVGPYLGLHSRLLGALGTLYERLLCRRCAGFVGWTPYLVGRALTYGAPRGMTAAGWTRNGPAPGSRERVRRALGVADDTLLVGLVGSLHWNEKVGYVYGTELVQAIRKVQRRDVAVCIVGDGDGLRRLQELAGDDLGRRVLLPGRVAPEQVPDFLAAFDAGSLSQSVDRVGSFRYSTKLSEYVAAGLPVITGQTPLAYDLDEGYFWRLPGDLPWGPVYTDALAELLQALTAGEVARRRSALAASRSDRFERTLQQRRMRDFVADILAERDRDG